MARKTVGIHDEREQFRNNTDGYIGAVTYAPNGDEKSVAIEPGGTVWLSPAEQELTAKAPKDAKDNPFIEQRVPVLDPVTGEKIDTRTITPLGRDDEERPIPEPRTARERQVAEAEVNSAAPPSGSHAPDEEVATPQAQTPAAASARRRRTPAKAATK